MKRVIGISFIYLAAVAIMFSIIFLFNVIKFDHAYSVAALGFLLYIVGVFLTREGKLTLYKISMIILAVVLILLALFKEFS